MRINEEKHEMIRKRADAGEDEGALAREYGLCRTTVTRIRKMQKDRGSERMTLERKEGFKAAWANIYPGDAERERRRKERDLQGIPGEQD